MDVNRKLVELLISKNLKISTAESITGGRVISTIIEVPGASNITEQSYVVYSNKAKISVLGVDKEIINRFGVVSLEVAKEMAIKVKELTGSDIVVSTTGEAGPNLSDEEIQVGTVCIGIIIKDKEYQYKRVFTGDRLGIINTTVSYILNEILIKLL